MKLDERFHISIEGSLTDVRRRRIIVPAELPYLLDRLFGGQAVAVEAFDGYRLRVIVEPDTGQGDDPA